jgi:chromatin segregation and condensation protein Rec8/ScpA/Scc1 (kleisin family)
MRNLERRLRDLESASDIPGSNEQEERRRREVLRRMTDDELRRYEEALEAAHERVDGAIEWRDEDLPILRRVEELTEDVAADIAAGREVSM